MKYKKNFLANKNSLLFTGVTTYQSTNSGEENFINQFNVIQMGKKGGLTLFV